MKSDAGCNDYLSQIQHDLGAGMALAVSSRGTTRDSMLWLDGDTGCQGDCTNKPTVIVKNIAYTEGNAPVPPAPGIYDYGIECSTVHDQDCANASPQCATH